MKDKSNFLYVHNGAVKLAVKIGGSFCEHRALKAETMWEENGDFPGEQTHDGNFCCDGLVFSDRSLKAGSLEAKAAYQPIRTTFENGVLTVYNRLDFTDLKEFDLYITIEADGEAVDSEQFTLHCPPHCRAAVRRPCYEAF